MINTLIINLKIILVVYKGEMRTHSLVKWIKVVEKSMCNLRYASGIEMPLRDYVGIKIINLAFLKK